MRSIELGYNEALDANEYKHLDDISNHKRVFQTSNLQGEPLICSAQRNIERIESTLGWGSCEIYRLSHVVSASR